MQAKLFSLHFLTKFEVKNFCLLPLDKPHPFFRIAKIIIGTSVSFVSDGYFSKNNLIWSLAKQELVNYRLEVNISWMGYKKTYKTTV